MEGFESKAEREREGLATYGRNAMGLPLRRPFLPCELYHCWEIITSGAKLTKRGIFFWQLVYVVTGIF